MKNNIGISLIAVIFVSFGCNLTNKSIEQTSTNNNSQIVATTSPTVTATPTPTASETPTTAVNALQDQTNLLAFASGTTFAKMPHDFYASGSGGAGDWTAFALIDELSSYGWAKRLEDGGAGETMVLEMPERSLLKTLSFDTKETDTDSTAKNITVEISDASATDGFQQVLATELKDKTDNQIFNLENPVPGRWVRLTIKDNYGSPRYTEIMEFRGYGEQLTHTALSNVSGTYKMERYGPMHIKQDGTSVAGCYEYSEGLIEGGVEGRVMRLKWSEGSKDSRRGGPAMMTFSQEGKKLTGVYGNDGTKGFSGVWNGEKISNEVGNCPHLPNLDKNNAAKDTIGTELKEKGRAAVYGINFDFNSDVIREESKPTLTQIVAILKENANWKMLIEGHTDNIGGESFNQTLSEKRAKAVKAFLVAAGIEESRLSSIGYGLSKPIAENTSEFGRAQNRRVELVKQ